MSDTAPPTIEAAPPMPDAAPLMTDVRYKLCLHAYMLTY